MTPGLRCYRFYNYHEAWLAVHQLEEAGFRATVCEEAVGHLWGPIASLGFCVWAFPMPEEEAVFPPKNPPPSDLTRVIRAMIASLIALGGALTLIIFWFSLLLLVILLPLMVHWAHSLSSLARRYHHGELRARLVMAALVFLLYPLELVMVWLFSAVLLPSPRNALKHQSPDQ